MFIHRQINYCRKSLKIIIGLKLIIFLWLISPLNAAELTIDCIADASATYTNIGTASYTWHGNYSGGTVKNFWKFSLASLPDATAGTYLLIDNAKLVLYGGNEGSQYTNLPTARIYQVLDNSWTETGVIEANAPLFDMALGRYDYPGSLQAVAINCTDYIQKMLDNGNETISFGSQAPNNYIDTINANRFRMISREYSNSAYRPKLVINYMSVPEIDASLAPVVTPTIGATTTPITHQQYFRGERELFAYAPLYTPAPITFDPTGKPYIRVGENPDGHDLYSEFTKSGVIQTLDDAGRWVYLRNFTQAIKTAYPSWNGEYSASVSMDERIVFDSDGDAYTVVETYYSLGFNVLLYSKDKCRTWTVYALPSYHQTRLEIPDGHNDTIRPPVIIALPYGFNGVKIDLISPVKNTDGTLTIPSAVTVTPDDKNWITPALGNATITKGNLTHVVYDSLTAVAGHAGTPQYIVTYNHVTKTVTAPVLLGVSDSTVPDLHDGPSITIDSFGYLHVVMGAHHGNFQYTKSLAANSSTAGWTTPIAIGRPKDGGGWSYVSLVCDKNDTLHVVGRYAGYFYYFGLWYIRKPLNGNWEDLGPLVMPFRNYYSHWYQCLSVNSSGKLFLSYIYYGDQYDRGRTTTYEIDAYKIKWPWEETHRNPNSTIDGWLGIQGHDPTVITSDDGGNSWQLLLTTDLIE